MSLYDYEVSRKIAAEDPPFYAIVMAAMRGADTVNAAKLRSAFPEVWAELDARYNAPGGWLPTDPNIPPRVRHCAGQYPHDAHTYTADDARWYCGGVS